MSAQKNTEGFRVFWMPGCSSCVKVKEFLAGLEVPYEPVNVLTDPDAAADLKRMGASSIPVVSRGDDFVFAQSLDDVAKFIGIDVKINRLPPTILMDRWFYFLNATKSLVKDIPEEILFIYPFPDRPRTLISLSHHVFQVAEAFLENMQNGLEDLNELFDEPIPETMRTADDVVAYGASIIARLEKWWDSVDDKTVNWKTNTFYGPQPVHTFMERSTWHSAQHARQIVATLEDRALPIANKIPRGAYAGLPMPQVIWQ